VLAIGSPGASRITTAIAQVLINLIALNMPLAAAIDHPRLHIETFGGKKAIAVEADLPLAEIPGFVIRRFPNRAMYFGGVQAVLWSPDTGLVAAADPRRTGGIAHGGDCTPSDG
jgi:gamma-glutamyltranspeptidase/glutathione hydrolase